MNTLINPRIALNSVWRRHWRNEALRICVSSPSLHAATGPWRRSPIASTSVQRTLVTTPKPSKLPTRKRKLFIENLPKDATDEEIFDFMSQLGGRIERAQTAVRVNNQSKGLGWVVFESVQDAQFAAKELQHKMLRGNRLIIRTSNRTWRSFPQESRSVFVANLRPATTDTDIITHFKRVGDVVSLQLPRDEDGQLLGHAFVEFVNPRQAEKAVQMLNHTTLQGRILSVRLHAKDNDVVHVTDLPENVPVTDLYKLFGQIGKIAYVRLPSPGRATVKYSKPEDAVKAVQVVSGTAVFGTSIKVVLARERMSLKSRREGKPENIVEPVEPITTDDDT